MAKPSPDVEETRKAALRTRETVEIVTIPATSKGVITESYLLEALPGRNVHIRELIRLARKFDLIFGRRGEVMTTTTGRMLAMVWLIGRHGLATVDNILDRFRIEQTNRRIAEKLLQQAFDERLLTRAGTLRGEDEVYVATYRGLKTVGLTNLRVSPLAATVEGHLRACVARAVKLELEYGPRYKVISERELEAINAGKRGSKRLASPYYFYRGGKHYKTPDLLVVLEGPNGEHIKVIAFEEELSKKSPGEGRAIGAAYRQRSHGVDLVVYDTSPLIIGAVNAMLNGAEDGTDGEGQDETDVESADKDEEKSLITSAVWDEEESELESPEKPREGDEDDEEESNPAGSKMLTPIIIKELSPLEVPAIRRRHLYRPEAVSAESRERFQIVRKSPEWITDIMPQLLSQLEWVCLNGMVAPDALMTRFALATEEDASDALHLSNAAGWLHRSEMLCAEREFFFATEEGLDAVGMNAGPWLVDYDEVSHYARSGKTCMRARVGAELASKHPHLTVRTRWELRADSLLNDNRILDVSKVVEFSGEHKRPDLILVDDDPGKPYGIVLVYPYIFSMAKIKAAVDAWLQHPRCAELLLYIDHPRIFEATRRFVSKLSEQKRVTVRHLPISNWEQKLRISREAPRKEGEH